MQWINLEQLKQLANSKELVYVLEDLLLDDRIGIYDEKTGKPVWFIHDYETLMDGIDILEEWLSKIEDGELLLEYYYRWSLSQYSFVNDRLHQVKVKVYLTDKGYRMEKYYNDGTYEVEILRNEKELLNRMGWHGYGRVLFFTYLNEDNISQQIMEWIRDRGSWVKILTKA